MLKEASPVESAKPFIVVTKRFLPMIAESINIKCCFVRTELLTSKNNSRFKSGFCCEKEEIEKNKVVISKILFIRSYFMNRTTRNSLMTQTPVLLLNFSFQVP